MAENNRVVKGKIAGQMKIGAGALVVGSPAWTGPESPVRYRDLVKNPVKYLRAVSKHFNIPVSKELLEDDTFDIPTDKSFIKDKFSKSEEDLYKKSEPVLIPDSYVKKQYPTKEDVNTAFNSQPVFSGYMNYDCYTGFTTPTYRLGYKHEKGNKLSRKLKYFLTCEELQYVIDTDLVDGLSGYDVSTIGNIQNPQFGPYMLQARATGDRSNNYLYIQNQSHEENISGHITGYHGSDEDNAVYKLGFSNTGRNVSQLYVYAYDLEVGKNYRFLYWGDTYRFFDNGDISLRNHRTIDYYVEDKDSINVARGLDVVTNPGHYFVPRRVSCQHSYNGITYLFNEEPDPNDTEKVLYITGAKPRYFNDLLWTYPMGMDNSIPIEEFKADGDAGDNGYNEENFWYVGAPYAYLGNRFQRYNKIHIKNSTKIEGLRVPNQNRLVNQCAIEQIRIENCTGFTDFLMPQNLTTHVDTVVISGCKLNLQNNIHRYHFSDYSKYPWHLTRQVPANQKSQFYYGDDMDDDYEYFNIKGHSNTPISSYELRHVNLNGNELNQTGCWHWIHACLAGGATYGYLDLRNQKYYDGPEDATFLAIRPDMYYGNDQRGASSWKDYVNNYGGVKDINNLCISGLSALIEKGWEVKIDPWREDNIHYADHLEDAPIGPYANIADGGYENYLGVNEEGFVIDPNQYKQLEEGDDLYTNHPNTRESVLN